MTTTQQSVTAIIARALPVTFSLAIGAAHRLIVGVVIGVMSAVAAAPFGTGVTVFVLWVYSMPTFVLGLLLLYVLYFRLTVAGFRSSPPPGTCRSPSPRSSWARHLILPWVTLAFVTAATYTRLTRATMLDVLGEDYIRTARAKGLSERRVVYRHGLRSALTPVVTQFGIDLGALLGGA